MRTTLAIDDDVLAAARELAAAERKRVQNGALRIIGSARYSNSPGTPAGFAELLRAFTGLPGHEFWPDHLTLLDARCADSARLLDPAQITGTYLLALSSAHGGQLSTFDRHLVTNPVAGGSSALHVIV